ncbi:MAG TPA: DUF3604 domain-containing protein, partial [Candidatus Bathyarchaeia archaeon]|nr:DUF3604 domain-containing protein [Candidatus Bathyarchaeia archaeon]
MKNRASGGPRSVASIVALSLAAAAIAACSDGSPKPAATANTKPPSAPWQRTEQRENCSSYNLLRNPYFGDLHVHTRLSADAYIYGTRVGPRDAYDFARGATIPLTDDNEQQTRSAHIDRSLDFAAVTDHSEFYGETKLCSDSTSSVYDLDICKELRQVEDPDSAARDQVTIDWLYLAGIPNPPKHLAFCNMPGVDCDAARVSVWQEIQAAAEEAYDRSSTCSFTSFIAYEHTASPLGRHLHRNIIFRNDHVPPFAASQTDTAADGTPQGVWKAIEDGCLNLGNGCDAVIIPHNSNLSGGDQFADPADATEAQRRQDREPLVEIHQIKGNSECRFDRLAGMGVGTDDELCTFEQQLIAQEGPGSMPLLPIQQYPARNMVRNALKAGIAFEQAQGVNPFKFGFIGGTDSHDATAGNTAEGGWPGGQGNNDSSPARQISSLLHTNPGGLAGVWAEENSRDALFDALRRRETFATSGTRPVVRLFGGSLAGVDCSSPDMVRQAYETGTPMGGDVGAVRGGTSPRFAVLAVKDPGTTTTPGTDLQRVQIVKGWVDASGTAHEKVFDVAGDANNGATVDPATCAPVGQGASELCTVWEDPEFNRAQRAFYYGRVLENPTCRWSTLTCKSVGVDPFASDCPAQATAAGSAFADCCLAQVQDPFLGPTIQERAWTSPIWYRPEAIATVDGAIEFGSRAGKDTLDLTIAIGQVPSSFDFGQADLSLQLTDDDQIYAVTFPAGA